MRSKIKPIVDAFPNHRFDIDINELDYIVYFYKDENIFFFSIPIKEGEQFIKIKDGSNWLKYKNNDSSKLIDYIKKKIKTI